jgi:hypothetical protein
VNPYLASRRTVDAVHGAMRGWAEGLLRAAECPEPVLTAFPEGDERAVVVMPYRLTLWPKLVENLESVPLLGAPIRGAQQAGIPEAWVRLAEATTVCIRSVFPTIRNKAGITVVSPSTSVGDLPKPLAGWYKGQGADSEWVIVDGKTAKARLPAMAWVPGIKLRVHYLVQAHGPDDPMEPKVGRIAAVTVGLHHQRTVQVPLPPAPMEERYTTFFRALADSCEGEAGERLAAALGAVTEVRPHRLTILPHEAPASDDFAEIMKSLGRRLQPTLLVMLQLPLAGYPMISPSVTPTFHTDAMARDEGAP